VRRSISATVAAVIVAFIACDPIDSFDTTPNVQPSADAEPRWTIDLNRILNGRYASYRPRCIDIREDQTVEFRNFLPDVPTNVTAIDAPAPLYSPNLVRPYNYVGPSDEDNPLCASDAERERGECPAFSYWRHTFDTPGVYDWIDTNQGAPGRKIVDAYYGTETFIGVDPNTPLATICVTSEDPSVCEGVCCETDADCTTGTRCTKNENEAVGRCLTL
jgi:hypothetical protein